MEWDNLSPDCVVERESMFGDTGSALSRDMTDSDFLFASGVFIDVIGACAVMILEGL